MSSGVAIFGTLSKSALIVVVLLLAVIAWLNWQVAVLCLILVLAIYLYNRKAINQENKTVNEHLDSVAQSVVQTSNFALQNLPVAIAIVDSKSRLCWSNSVFKDWVHTNIERTQRIGVLLPSLRLDKIWGKSGFFNTIINNNHYRVIYKYIDMGDNSNAEDEDAKRNDSYMAFYFDDVTESEKERILAVNSMPVFCYIQLDNFDDVTKGLSDVETTNLWAEVNNAIVEEIDKYDGFIRSYTDESYIACLSREALDDLIKNNFPILSRVHSLHTPRRVPVTISMGLATISGSMKEQAEKARAGLELSLGRGGDQATVYTGSEAKFYGGKMQNSEKNTRVRARVVSQAIKEIMSDVTNVVIMGHEREDYDSIGGAVGVSVLAKLSNKPVNIAISGQDFAIKKLTDHFVDDHSFEDLFVTPEEAEKLVADTTLVFVVDVHRPDMVAAPKALLKSKKRIVIDHHRRSSDFIDKPLLTYLEPTSSSTSELVTELIQYFSSNSELSVMEASALYAGIIVDTKNFVVQTGSRTFDAASYLRRSGADLKVVRHLFSDSFEALQVRSSMFANAERIGDLAFSECPESVKDNAAILSAQVADILITIEGVEASFTFYHLPDNVIGVSARSQGNVNVQVIMEALGGGGHRTVAGLQFSNKTMTEAKAEVMKVAREEVAKQKEEK